MIKPLLFLVVYGVGASVVNALSEWCFVEVRKDGVVYKQSYATGTPTSGLEEWHY